MAVDILGSTIMPVLVLKTEDQSGPGGRNWCVEIVEITFGTNTGTSLVLSNDTTTWPAATVGTGPLKMVWPMFCSADGIDVNSTVSENFTCAYAKGSVTITFAAAPTSCVIRFKIEGLA